MSMLLQYAQQTGMHEYYPELLSNEDVQKSYRSFFDVLLSDDEGAVLWHCSQGKDRAGLASMLVLRVLGASRETILEDFALSALAYDASAKQVMTMFEQRGVDEETRNRLHGIISVDRQNMETALDFVDETYGGMDALEAVHLFNMARSEAEIMTGTAMNRSHVLFMFLPRRTVMQASA